MARMTARNSLLKAHWPQKGDLGETICFKDPEQSPLLGTGCKHTHFLGGMETCAWTSWQAPHPSKSICVHLGKLLFSAKGAFWAFYSWFWWVSTIENCLWALNVIWAFCQLVLMGVYCWLWAQSVIIGHFGQLVLTYVWCGGPFLWKRCLFGTQYWLFSWQICDGSVFWCVYMYSICVISIFVIFCKMGSSGSIY